MADSKRYTVVNRQAGPRGFTSAADGTVLLAPLAPGDTQTGGTAYTLTDDEVEAAEGAGLEVNELGDNDRAIAGTENLPAEGYVDFNHPDAADFIGGDQPRQRSQRKQGKQAKQAEQPDQS